MTMEACLLLFRSMTSHAIIDRPRVAACVSLFAMAVAAKSVKQAVDAHGFGQGELLVAGDAVLRAGPVNEIVVAGRTGEAAMIGMGKPGMVDWRNAEFRQT